MSCQPADNSPCSDADAVGWVADSWTEQPSNAMATGLPTDAHCQNLSLGQHSCMHSGVEGGREGSHFPPNRLTPGLMSCQQPWFGTN